MTTRTFRLGLSVVLLSLGLCACRQATGPSGPAEGAAGAADAAMGAADAGMGAADAGMGAADVGMGAASGSALVGPVWQWLGTSMPDDESVSPENPAMYALIFRADGTAMVHANCNTGRGAYTIDGAALTFEELSMPRVDCGDDSLSQVFADQLRSAGTYTLTADSLFINLVADGGDMRFQKPPSGGG